MLIAAFRAFGDVVSADFRQVLFKAVGLALVLFVLLFLSVQAAFWFLTLLPYPWLESLAAIGAGLGMLAAFFFLMAPVTSLFAGLYLDHVAAKVEAKHYAADGAGKPLSGFRAITISMQFAVIVLVANVLALPLVFTGFGIIVLFVINAYLISREYFEMVAMRYMAPLEAKAMRKANAVQVFLAGLVPAALALVPVVNLTVPLFATSYFVHLFKQVRES
jgi:CysZ protein